jgi:hypothetical protein
VSNLIAVLVVQIPVFVAAVVAIWRAVVAEQALTAHTARMTTSTPFLPSELDMIGHAARSMAKDYLQTVDEQNKGQVAPQASMGLTPGGPPA